MRDKRQITSQLSRLFGTPMNESNFNIIHLGMILKMLESLHNINFDINNEDEIRPAINILKLYEKLKDLNQELIDNIIQKLFSVELPPISKAMLSSVITQKDELLKRILEMQPKNNTSVILYALSNNDNINCKQTQTEELVKNLYYSFDDYARCFCTTKKSAEETNKGKFERLILPYFIDKFNQTEEGSIYSKLKILEYCLEHQIVNDKIIQILNSKIDLNQVGRDPKCQEKLKKISSYLITYYDNRDYSDVIDTVKNKYIEYFLTNKDIDITLKIDLIKYLALVYKDTFRLKNKIINKAIVKFFLDNKKKIYKHMDPLALVKFIVKFDLEYTHFYSAIKKLNFKTLDIYKKIDYIYNCCVMFGLSSTRSLMSKSDDIKKEMTTLVNEFLSNQKGSDEHRRILGKLLTIAQVAKINFHTELQPIITRPDNFSEKAALTCLKAELGANKYKYESNKIHGNLEIDLLINDRIAVMYDGPSHFKANGKQNKKTRLRDCLLEDQGFKIIIFRDDKEREDEIKKVADKIIKESHSKKRKFKEIGAI